MLKKYSLLLVLPLLISPITITADSVAGSKATTSVMDSTKKILENIPECLPKTGKFFNPEGVTNESLDKAIFYGTSVLVVATFSTAIYRAYKQYKQQSSN